jgi:hypothetical protein
MNLFIHSVPIQLPRNTQNNTSDSFNPHDAA